MKAFIKANMLIATGLIVGAVGGYLYWNNVGCSTGHCMITSHPVNSTIYGAFMGGLLFSMFKPAKSKNKNEYGK